MFEIGSVCICSDEVFPLPPHLDLLSEGRDYCTRIEHWAGGGEQWRILSLAFRIIGWGLGGLQVDLVVFGNPSLGFLREITCMSSLERQV